MSSLIEAFQRRIEQKKKLISSSFEETPQVTEEKPKNLQSAFANRVQEKEKKQSDQSILRTAWQPIAGFLSTTTPGLAAGFWQLLAMGEAYDPEEIDRLESISLREGVPFDREKYMQAAESALSYIPTISNLERIAEEKTGLPLQPKTREQKGIRFLTEASRLAPSNLSLRPLNDPLPKSILGGGVTAAKEMLTEMGVPEQISEPLSFLVLKKPLAIKESLKSPLEVKKKPSGLTERQFESLSKPTIVSPERHAKINEKLESDFRNIANELIGKSPVSETRKTLKENPEFKVKSAEAFGEVEKLASQIPENILGEELSQSLLKKTSEKRGEGIVPGEYRKTYNSFIDDYLQKLNGKTFNNRDLVKQYRENNKDLGQIFEAGKSTAYNNAKKDALLDFNQSIADLIQSKYPNSEYANLFKETNAQWSKIMDAEKIDKFLDDLFSGKVNYGKADEFFAKENLKKTFTRALGEQGYKDFIQLMKDLMSSKQAMSLLKIVEKQGFGDFIKKAALYAVSPSLAKAKFGLDIGKSIYKTILDKPKLLVPWKNGLKAIKNGNFQKAEKELNAIQKEVKF
jgi:hypothetical protein